VNDYDNFGTRITEIRVAVAKIWRKEVIGTNLEFLEVARVISRIIFKNQRVFLKIRGPWFDFTEEKRANYKIGGDFPAQNYFSVGKHNGLSPPFMDS
jgi:hypothetical protein